MKQLLVILSLLMSTFGFGQASKFNFKVGSAYELPKNAEDLCYFGTEKTGIVNLSIRKKELNILRFDPKTLEKTSEATKELPDITPNFNAEIPFYFGGKHYWIHSDWDAEAEKELLFYDQIDVSNGNFIEKDKKMLEATKIKGTSSTGFFGSKATGKYRFRTDADIKMLLVNYKLYPKEKNDKKNNDVIGLCIFDNSMKKLWVTEYLVPTTEQVTDLVNYGVDSKGNAYLVTKIYTTEKRYYEDPKTKKQGFYFEVSKFSKDSKEPQVTRIELGDYYIGEVNLVENKAHEMLICGTYRKNSKPDETVGVFVGMLDNQGKMKTIKDGLYPFPASELSKYETAKTRKKIERADDYEPPPAVIRGIQPVDDGSLYVICEQYRYERKEYTNYNHTFFYYDDVLCMKIDNKGNMEWCTKIPKQQLGTDSYQTLGINMMYTKSNFYFLYIDNKKNLDLDIDNDPKEHLNGYGGNIFVAKVDAKGNLTREILFNPFDEKMMILPTSFTTLEGNKFLGRAMLFRGGYRPILISPEE